MNEFLHEETTKDIIGASMTVLNTLRAGLSEKIYERALIIELTKQGHKTESQREFTVRYDGHEVGKLIPDLIVDDIVIVDTKVVESFHDAHIAQMLGYLAITELNAGLLVNFKHSRLKWKRLVR